MPELNLRHAHQSVLRDAGSTPSAGPPQPQASKLDLNSVKMLGPEKDNSNASLYFFGTNTTILSWEGMTILIDPAPAVELDQLPNIDLVLFSSTYTDQLNQSVAMRLRRDLPIITTPLAKKCLVDRMPEVEKFTAVEAVGDWNELAVSFPAPLPPAGGDSFFPTAGCTPRLRIIAIPGTHIGDGKTLPGGWILELGHSSAIAASSHDSGFECGYRICIAGGSLSADNSSHICERYTYAGKQVDLMLTHLGGTTASETAKQIVHSVQIIQPKTMIPIHSDDTPDIQSHLNFFKTEAKTAGMGDHVVYLNPGQDLRFHVRG